MIQFQSQIMNYYILIFYFFHIVFSIPFFFFYFSILFQSHIQITFFPPFLLFLFNTSLIFNYTSLTQCESIIFSSYNAEPWCIPIGRNWCGSTCSHSVLFFQGNLFCIGLCYRKTDLYKVLNVLWLFWSITQENESHVIGCYLINYANIEAIINIFFINKQ